MNFQVAVYFYPTSKCFEQEKAELTETTFESWLCCLCSLLFKLFISKKAG